MVLRDRLWCMLTASARPWETHKINLSDGDISDMRLFEYDKDSVTTSIGERVPGIDAALKGWSEKAPTLYRGLSKEEAKQLEAGAYVSSRDMSMSEELASAVKFAKQYRTNIVVAASGLTGFCYWQWLYDYTTKEIEEDDPTYYMRDWAKEEKEWLLPMGLKFAEKKHEKRAGVTLVEIARKS